MRAFIKETLVEAYKTIDTDRYGQVPTFNKRPSLFGDMANEVRDYCEQNKGILTFSTYGSRVGNYEAFEIDDMDISRACSLALKENEGYLINVNNW
jgi:hypothetical protein